MSIAKKYKKVRSLGGGCLRAASRFGSTGIRPFAAALGAAFALSVAPAQGAVTIYAWDAGTDVRIAWSGSLDLTDLASVQLAGGGDQLLNTLRGTAQLFQGPVDTDATFYPVDVYAFDSFSQPTGAIPGSLLRLGSSTDFPGPQRVFGFDADVAPDPNTTAIFLTIAREDFGISPTYESGSPLAGSGTLFDLSLDAMEVFPGNYRFNLADSTEYIEFRMGEAPAPVPLPPAFGMLAAGLAGLRWFTKRRHPA